MSKSSNWKVVTLEWRAFKRQTTNWQVSAKLPLSSTVGLLPTSQIMPANHAAVVIS